MTRALKFLRLPLLVLGLAALFAADRYFAFETYHGVLRWGGAVLTLLGALGALALSFRAQSAGYPAEARSYRHAFWGEAGIVVGLVLYLIYGAVLGDKPSPESSGEKILLGAWLTVLTLGFFATVGAEWALRENGEGELAEPKRVARGGLSWLAVGMLLVFLAGLNYAGAKKDVISDWSYLKTSSPSPSTEKMLKTLEGELEIALFYPRTNDVRTMLADYFDTVAAKEPGVKVSYYDKDMHPKKAEKFRVSRHGQIVFSKGGERARIDTGTTVDDARETLKKLDQKFQEKFLELTAEQKTIYFTRGHGEHSWVGDQAEQPLHSLSMLERGLRQQNYKLEFFGLGEGSASAVPDDAAAVVVVGPNQPFRQEEVDVLKRYVEDGGRLLVFWDLLKPQDPDAPGLEVQADEKPLLAYLQKAGLAFQPVPLANDRKHVTASRSGSDKWFIYTNVFTSHDSVVNLSRHDERAALLLYQSGYLKTDKKPDGYEVRDTVRTLSSTFIDENRNFSFDKDSEKRDSYVVGAIASTKGSKRKSSEPGRVLLFADASVVSDALIRNPGNALFVSDTLKWMVGDEERTGKVASEEDVKIRHTRKEDVMWFHGTVVAMPLLVLLVGFVATRGRKRKTRASKE